MFPDGSVHSRRVSAPSSQVTLTGLKKYTNYSIWVSASTEKGNGNASKSIIVTTDEDSKCLIVPQTLQTLLIVKTFKAVLVFVNPIT